MQLSSLPWERFLPHLDFSRSRYALGLLFILCQCVVWIAAAVLTQHIYEDQDSFSSPFLMTYVGMALMALFLPIEWWNERCTKDGADANAVIDLSASLSFDSFAHELESVQSPSCLVNAITTCSINLADKTKQKRWNHKKHMLAAFYIAPAMFVADWSFNAALRHTSVASVTVIVSLQNVVVFLLALLFKIEDFCWIKLAGVLLSMIGMALTAYHDSDDEESADRALLGDLMAVIAALAYGTYTVQSGLFCPQNEELYKMHLLMGYIGLTVLVPLLPFAAYLMYNVRSDLTWTIMGFIAIKGLLDFVVTDYLLFRSVVLTSATVATVGLGLTIPMAFMADCIFHPDGVMSIYSVIGALSAGVGFVSVSLSPGKGKEAEVEEEERSDEVRSSFVLT